MYWSKPIPRKVLQNSLFTSGYLVFYSSQDSLRTFLWWGGTFQGPNIHITRLLYHFRGALRIVANKRRQSIAFHSYHTINAVHEKLTSQSYCNSKHPYYLSIFCSVTFTCFDTFIVLYIVEFKVLFCLHALSFLSFCNYTYGRSSFQTNKSLNGKSKTYTHYL